MAEEGLDPTGLLIMVIGMVAMVLLVIAIYASRYQRVPPDKALVIFGKVHDQTYSFMEDGRMKTATRRVGYRIVRGGGTFVSPIIERVGWLPLESTTLESHLAGIRTKDGSTITVDLVSQFKLRGDDTSLRTASENYLDKPMAHIADSGRTVLESRARTVLTGMTLPEISADREAAALKVAEKVQEDFQRTGLGLMTLVVKDVLVEKRDTTVVKDETIKPGDLFKVVKNASGELIVQRVTTGVEG
jgi:flotillin